MRTGIHMPNRRVFNKNLKKNHMQGCGVARDLIATATATASRSVATCRLKVALSVPCHHLCGLGDFKK
jgi:hypothetical protein